MSRKCGCLSYLALVAALCAGGCSAPPVNTSFSVTMSEADAALRQMRARPKALERPLVILAGFCDPGLASSILGRQFRKLTGDERVLDVSFFFCGDFDACRSQLIAAVDKAFPCDDPAWTTEVDVIGLSMGGLVGRYAAAPAQPGKSNTRRLRVARLFTISTPHRGAALATMPTFSRLQLDMRADSRFLHRLSAAEFGAGGYPVYPYVRLGDVVVGAKNAAPYGKSPWWVPGDPLLDSHLMAMLDSRIIADVARRLRGETPLTTEPPTPLPGVALGVSDPPGDSTATQPGTAHIAASP